MGILKGFVIGIVVMAIIVIIMDYKAKNFTSELYKLKIYIGTYLVLNACILYFGSIDTKALFNATIHIVVITVIFILYMFLNKSKIYHFKGMDKKIIKENTDEISKIITDYKNNNLDEKSQITFIDRRIIFEGVGKSGINECLTQVGEYLDEIREAYTVKDYVLYYLKSTILPLSILIVLIFIVLRKVINIF